MSTQDNLPAEPIAKSYLWHKGQIYFVSTIDRDSSAAYYQSRYAETMVWTWDWDKRERGELIHQDEGSQGSITTHLAVCKKLHEGGAEALRNDD